MTDFRSDPMPSSEGRGLARQAWDAYARTTRKVLSPAVETLLGPSIKSYSAGTVSDLVGFWVLWHLYGGFEGMRGLGMSRASIYRKVSMFRRLFGSHPDEFQMPGVTLDIGEYLSGAARSTSGRSRKPGPSD